MIRVQSSKKLNPRPVKTSMPIGLHPPVLALEKETLVGGHATNPARIYQVVHRWGSTFEVDANEFNFALRDELLNHGYKFAIGSRAAFQLRPKVTKIVYNLFGTNPRSGWSEAEVHVSWELSGISGFVVKTVGSATTRQHSLASLFMAFRVALRNFLADNRVAMAVASPVGQQTAGRENKSPSSTGGISAASQGSPRQAVPSTNVRKIAAPPVSSTPLGDSFLVQNGRRSVTTVLVGDAWGSGTVLTEDGLIVTTYELARKVGSMSVVTFDGQEITASVLLLNKEANLALVKAQSGAWTPIFFRKNRLVRGEPVVVIGTPFHPALSHSVSRGRIMKSNKVVSKSNARVSAGNAGGPAIDGLGRAVGVVTWPAGRTAPAAKANIVPAVDVLRSLKVNYQN